ncbi:MAG TPA: tyrosine-protein phosphatase [Steroidobacteraceae bacterium]|nr:tyrosine-protein phosphatase [Steroidobacteraceae bacterium]
MSLDSPAAMTPLLGMPNFRDFGGHPTADGRSVRYGRLYRSQSLHFATEEDLEQLARMDIKLVCDLRSRRERRRHPGRWHTSTDPVRLHLDISTDARAGNTEFAAVVQASPDYAGVYRGMMLNYRNFPRSFAPVLRELFSHLADEKHLPAVIHCHAGKDRTGFVCAVVLAALGVDREHVLADYLLTEQRMDRVQISAGLAEVFSHFIGVHLAPEALRPAVEVHEEYLKSSLEQIDAAHGGMDAYLEQVGGLTPAKRDQLKALLLE